MIGILEFFGVIELAIIVIGILLIVFLQEIAKLMGFAFLVYGSGFNAMAFLIVMVAHDHVHISLR